MLLNQRFVSFLMNITYMSFYTGGVYGLRSSIFTCLVCSSTLH